MMRAYVVSGLLGVGALLGACGGSSTTTSTTGETTSTTSSTTGSGGGGGSSTTSTTGAGGSMPVGDWSCVGQVTWPASAVPKAEVNLTFTKLIGSGTLEGLNVKVCDKADATCSAPLAMEVTDAMGAVKLFVSTGATGFDGYLDVSGGTVVPALIYYLPPIGADIPAGTLEVPLVTEDNLALITGLAGGLSLDPTRGQLLALAYDCAGDNAVGVQIAASNADAKSTQAYLQGSALSLEAKQTDESGGSVIFNLPAGASDISVTLPGAGTLTAKSGVTIRAGAFTYATLPPTPKQ